MKRKESEPMSKILDTTVLVDIIRRKEVALDYVDGVGKTEGTPRLSIVTSMELVIGCHDKNEVRKVEKLLADYEVLDITPLIVRHFLMIEGLRLEKPY